MTRLSTARMMTLVALMLQAWPARAQVAAPSQADMEQYVVASLTCDQDVHQGILANEAVGAYADRIRREGWDPDRPEGLAQGHFPALGVVFDEMRRLGQGAGGLDVVGISKRGRVEPLLRALEGINLKLVPTTLTIGATPAVKAWSLTDVVERATRTITVVEGQVHEGLPGVTPGGVSLLCATRAEGATHVHLALALPTREEAEMRQLRMPFPRRKDRPTALQIDRVFGPMLQCDHRALSRVPPADFAHVSSYFYQSNPTRPEDGGAMAGPFKVMGVTVEDISLFLGGMAAPAFMSFYLPDGNLKTIADMHRKHGHVFASRTEQLGRFRSITVLESTLNGRKASSRGMRVVLGPARFSSNGDPNAAIPGGVTVTCVFDGEPREQERRQ